MTDTNEVVAQALEALNAIKHPVFDAGLVELNFARNVIQEGDTLSFVLALPIYEDPNEADIKQKAEAALGKIEGIKKINIETKSEVLNDGRTREGSAANISNVIAVASGKGGVGKSTMAVNLAVALAQSGAKVGLVDTDVYGPNVPRMVGVERLPAAPSSDNKLTPAEAYGVKLMSIGFLVKPEQAMVWRGPMLHNAIRQFVQDVEWGELDYLIVDMPPGTGDVQLSLAQTTPLSGGMIVTLPQEVSVDDARRGMEMFRQMEIPIFGVVENMSYLDVGNGKRMEVFGSGGGAALSKEMGVELIAQIPMDPDVREGGDNGRPIVAIKPESPTAIAIKEVATRLALIAAVSALESQKQAVPIMMVEE